MVNDGGEEDDDDCSLCRESFDGFCGDHGVMIVQ